MIAAGQAGVRACSCPVAWCVITGAAVRGLELDCNSSRSVQAQRPLLTRHCSALLCPAAVRRSSRSKTYLQVGLAEAWLAPLASHCEAEHTVLGAFMHVCSKRLHRFHWHACAVCQLWCTCAARLKQSACSVVALSPSHAGDVGTNIWSTPDAAAASSSSSSGDDGDSSTRAKLVSTGIYTFYRDELALQVGTQEDPAKYGFNITAGLGGQFLQNCLDACDDLSNRCAGARLLLLMAGCRPVVCMCRPHASVGACGSN